MSQTDLEKFLETVVKVQPGPGDIPKGMIDGIELVGEALIARAIMKGKELGYDFTNEEIENWFERQRTSGAAASPAEIDLDDLADAFKERDKWLDDNH